MIQHFLPEQDGHVISYTVHGNPEGPSIMSFHGGPGSQSKPHHASRFDLEKYQVVLFDQRGCGMSTPRGSIEFNTTEKTLGDAERIREALGIESWFVSGGSWGSTLALLYAIKHPTRTLGLLLSGLWLADTEAKEWEHSEKGLARIMPDVYEKRAEFLEEFSIDSEHQAQEMLEAFKNADEETAKKLALGVVNWENNLFTPLQEVKFKMIEDITEDDVASSKIFVHYEANQEFLPEHYIFDNLHTISDIPTIIVQGRYDILCPLYQAKSVADALNNSTLIIATSSGHALTSEGTTIQKLAYDRFLSEQTCKKFL